MIVSASSRAIGVPKALIILFTSGTLISNTKSPGNSCSRPYERHPTGSTIWPRATSRCCVPWPKVANRCGPQGAGAAGGPQASSTPTFGPTILCRLVGMSRSNLYRMFEDTGGVTRYIQRERLLEAHPVLTDLATTQSISAIAEDLCFADASSFSRTFKREFGHTPSEVRSAALGGLAPSATPRSGLVSPAGDFAELLRGF
jgi:AraC-like DNA-binding protein